MLEEEREEGEPSENPGDTTNVANDQDPQEDHPALDSAASENLPNVDEAATAASGHGVHEDIPIGLVNDSDSARVNDSESIILRNRSTVLSSGAPRDRLLG